MDARFDPQTGAPLTGPQDRQEGNMNEASDVKVSPVPQEPVKPETRPIPPENIRHEQEQEFVGVTHPSQQDPQRPYEKSDGPTMHEFLELKERVEKMEAFADRFARRFGDK